MLCAQIAVLNSSTPDATGRYGSAVAFVPDVDGDGYHDVVVGGPLEEGSSPSDEGHAHVFSGRTGQYLRILRSPHAPVPWAAFGLAVGGIRDLNGDGRGEIVVGAPGDIGDDTTLRLGGVHVSSGTDGGLIRSLRSPFELGGFGAALARISDVNLDFHDDVLVSQRSTLGARAIVLSSITGEPLYTFASDQPSTPDDFSYDVAGMPDADGDGVGDFLLSSPSELTDSGLRGRVYQYSGRSGMLLRILESPDPDSGGFGWSVAGVPDLDSDGRGDILVGTINTPREGQGPRPLWLSGRVWAFSGATGAYIRSLHSPNPVQTGFFGEVVAGIPDANGDGFGDILVGARLEWPFGRPIGSGTVYLICGATGRVLRSLLSPQPEQSGWFGADVAGVMSAAFGGRPTILVGATGEDGGTHNSGRAYLFLPCPADFDASGRITSQDFFDFVSAYFASLPSADFDHSGIVDSQDFFDFLAAFFVGCS